MQKIVAILPMRDGSQRVINKNSRVINGKHLYEYIIDKLLNFNLISKIIINTDIEMVHEKYISNNKIILVRRNNNLKGNCDINLVISDSIKNIEADLFIQVHATNPLFKSTSLKKAIIKPSLYKERLLFKDRFSSKLKFFEDLIKSKAKYNK